MSDLAWLDEGVVRVRFSGDGPLKEDRRGQGKMKWRGIRKEFVQSCWEQARIACGVGMTFYEATRHSFISRNLEAGVSLDEVSAAVGHSSPVVTKRHYDRFVRRTFGAVIRGVRSG